MCNYNFELPVEPIPLMEMVRQMVINNGGTVTGEIPNVTVTFPTPMGQVAGSCRIVVRQHRQPDRDQEAGSLHLCHGARAAGSVDHRGSAGLLTAEPACRLARDPVERSDPFQIRKARR